jgi:hypothetical protein
MTLVMTGLTTVETRNERGRPTTYTASEEDIAVGVGVPVVVDVRGRDAYFDVDAMEIGRPYAYRLEGASYVAVRRDDGRVFFYELPTR